MVEWIEFEGDVRKMKQKARNLKGYLEPEKVETNENKMRITLKKLQKEDVHVFRPNMGRRSVSSDVAYEMGDFLNGKVVDYGFGIRKGKGWHGESRRHSEARRR